MENSKDDKLFEFIRSRLPTDYELGDIGQIIENGVPNHAVFNQDYREDHEGDVGIFEVNTTPQNKYLNIGCYISEVQVAVVTPRGEKGTVRAYLEQLYKNIENDNISDDVLVDSVRVINTRPLSPNKSGKQCRVLNMILHYRLKEEE